MDTIAQCRALYRQAFGDDEPEFEKALFDNCFKYCKFISENEKIVSMLFLMPTVLKTEVYNLNCGYIYAAATLKECRGKGYMSRLIKEIGNNIPLFLKPANDSLIKFYKNLGFKTVSAEKSTDFPMLCPAEDFLTLAELFPDDENKEKYIAMYFAKDIKIEKLNFIQTME